MVGNGTAVVVGMVVAAVVMVGNGTAILVGRAIAAVVMVSVGTVAVATRAAAVAGVGINIATRCSFTGEP